MLGEEPVGAFGGDPSGQVGVGGHERGGAVVGVLGCLGLGEGVAQWRDPDVGSVGGQGTL